MEPDGRVTLHADRLTIAQLLQLRDTFSRVHGECPIIIRCGGTPDLTFTDCDEPSSDRIAPASG